jgi:hypothetical protein
MPVRRAARTGHLADSAQYRALLTQLAQERARAHATAERATQDITELLPQAIQAGLSVVDAAQLTGLSRPTVYRMLSESRRRRPLRDVAAKFEQALDADNRALPYEIASAFGMPIEHVFEELAELYPLVTEDFTALGPAAVTSLIELLPELDVPERIVLTMLLLQSQTMEYVAASTQLSGNEVVGWATLGLLRVLPRIRAANEGTAQPSSTAVRVKASRAAGLRDAILAILPPDQPLHTSAIRTVLIEAGQLEEDQKAYLVLQGVLSGMFTAGEVARPARDLYIRRDDS